MVEPLSSRIHFAVFGPNLSYDDGFLDVTDAAFLRERVSGGKTLAAFRVALPNDGGFDSPTEYTTRFSRYLSDGARDNTFGKNGVLDVGITSNVRVVQGSRILAVPEFGQVIRSYTLNGRVDSTFGGGDGVADIPLNAKLGGNVVLSDSSLVQVLDDGRLLTMADIATVKSTGSGPSTVLHQHNIAILNVDGSLDSTFGYKGFVSFRQDRGNVRPFITDDALYIHADYLGSTEPPSGDIIKLALNGKTADLNFGGDGRVAIPGFVGPIVVQPDGKLLFIDSKNGGDPTLYRLNTNGTPDTSFSGDGKVLLPDPNFPNLYSSNDLFIDDQNRIVVSANDTIYRYSQTGALDAYPFNGMAPFPTSIESVDTQGNVLGDDGKQYGMVLPQQLDANGIVQVVSDARDDMITASDAGNGKIRVVVNEDSRLFRAVDVKGFNIQTFDGDLELHMHVNRAVTLQGGDGDAAVFASDADDNIDLGYGKHEVVLGAGNDRAEIGNIPNVREDPDLNSDDVHVVVGTGGNKTIQTNNGIATINLAAGNHEVRTVRHAHGSKITIAGGNNEVWLDGDRDESLTIGGRGNNNITSFSPNVKIVTGTGRDTVLAISPSGTIHTTGGNDEVKIRNFVANPTTGITVFAGSGNDNVFCDPGYHSLATVYGGPGDDRLTGGTLTQRLYGENGNDTLDGRDGNDYLYGGDLDDVIIGGANSDRLYGEGGNDKLYGRYGNDTLAGGNGDDRLFAQTGSDVLFGDAGNDRLYSDDNGGTFTMHGGVGNDIFNTRNGRVDTLFGDGGTDVADADADDVLNGVTRA